MKQSALSASRRYSGGPIAIAISCLFAGWSFWVPASSGGHGVCSNHLNVIAERGSEEAVAQHLIQALTAGLLGAWDELVLPMMDADSPMPSLLTAAFRDAGLSASPSKRPALRT